jgi:hypothetical protein
MADFSHSTSESTAVDDVRRVRERIHRESGGDLKKHIEETNRVFEALGAKLGVNVVSPPPAQSSPKSANG